MPELCRTGLRIFGLFVLIIGAYSSSQRFPGTSAQEAYPANLYSELRWRNIGPFRAGRVNAVSGVIGQPSVYYFGSVGGGVWKSNNSGRTWTPIFDSERVASIGGIGVAPSNANVIYVGTGEADLRDSISFGNGMYKSIDAGKTWKHLGLRTLGKLVGYWSIQEILMLFLLPCSAMFTDPTLIAASIARRMAARPGKKFYTRTTMSARSIWRSIPPIHKSIYASLWNVRRPPWFIYAPANGPGAGIFKSTDGGNTWKQLSRDCPPKASAASDSQCRREIAIEFTRSLMPRKVVCSLRVMPA